MTNYTSLINEANAVAATRQADINAVIVAAIGNPSEGVTAESLKKAKVLLQATEIVYENYGTMLNLYKEGKLDWKTWDSIHMDANLGSDMLALPENADIKAMLIEARQRPDSEKEEYFNKEALPAFRQMIPASYMLKMGVDMMTDVVKRMESVAIEA